MLQVLAETLAFSLLPAAPGQILPEAGPRGMFQRSATLPGHSLTIFSAAYLTLPYVMEQVRSLVLAILILFGEDCYTPQLEPLLNCYIYSLPT